MLPSFSMVSEEMSHQLLMARGDNPGVTHELCPLLLIVTAPSKPPSCPNLPPLILPSPTHYPKLSWIQAFGTLYKLKNRLSWSERHSLVNNSHTDHKIQLTLTYHWSPQPRISSSGSFCLVEGIMMNMNYMTSIISPLTPHKREVKKHSSFLIHSSLQ